MDFPPFLEKSINVISFFIVGSMAHKAVIDKDYFRFSTDLFAPISLRIHLEIQGFRLGMSRAKT
jgi:hypothetical protein